MRCTWVLPISILHYIILFRHAFGFSRPWIHSTARVRVRVRFCAKCLVKCFIFVWFFLISSALFVFAILIVGHGVCLSYSVSVLFDFCCCVLCVFFSLCWTSVNWGAGSVLTQAMTVRVFVCLYLFVCLCACFLVWSCHTLEVSRWASSALHFLCVVEVLPCSVVFRFRWLCC